MFQTICGLLCSRAALFLFTVAVSHVNLMIYHIGTGMVLSGTGEASCIPNSFPNAQLCSNFSAGTGYSNFRSLQSILTLNIIFSLSLTAALQCCSYKLRFARRSTPETSSLSRTVLAKRNEIPISAKCSRNKAQTSDFTTPHEVL